MDHALDGDVAAGETPLFRAALYGQFNTVRLLIERGADPNNKKPLSAPQTDEDMMRSVTALDVALTSPLVNQAPPRAFACVYELIVGGASAALVDKVPRISVVEGSREIFPPGLSWFRTP